MMNINRFLMILPLGLNLLVAAPVTLADDSCPKPGAEQTCRHPEWRDPAAVLDDGHVRSGTVQENSERQLPTERFTLWALPSTPVLQNKGYTEAQLKPVRVEIASPRFPSGGARLGADTIQRMNQLLEHLKGKTGLRLHVIGHTDNQSLSVKAQRWFRDNQALSLARAQAVATFLKQTLKLPDTAVTASGMGASQPIAGNDTPEGMAKNRRVEIEVWYDKAAPDNAGPVAEASVKRRVLCRSLTQSSEAASGAFSISVDGEPVRGGEKDSENIQRCTDVALANTRVQLQYDNLLATPRLDVSVWPATATAGETLYFQGYSNYLAWVDRAEVRIFTADASYRGRPLAIVALNDALSGHWLAPADAPDRLQYRLRVYDKAGRYDETESLPLWKVAEHQVPDDDQLAPTQRTHVAYGKNRLQRQTIHVRGGTITVNGKAVPQDHDVYFMGQQIPLDAGGDFVARQIIPEGRHTVEVAILDASGDGELFWRDIEFAEQDWFTVGLADVTIGSNSVHGPGETVTQDSQHLGSDSYVDGRLAFYTRGKWRNYTVTASADSREEPLDSLFSNFADKDPRALLRRLDSESVAPTYGDDSSLVEDAPTQGKFYARIEDERSYALWGNFKARYQDTDLAQINRGLYGATLDWKSRALTAQKENRSRVRVFAADPGTLAARETLRGTGGSLYYLGHQDITQGSERLQVEVRDKDSGIVLSVNNLVAGQDYTVDSLQGRVLLTRALPSTADDSQLVRAGSLSGTGNPVYLVADYEYTPGTSSISDMAVGGRVSQWLTDELRIGLTGSRQKLSGSDQDLGGLDLLYRKTAETYIRLETARTDGPGIGSRDSIDGGFNFSPTGTAAANNLSANAYQLESGFRLDDLGLESDGQGNLYLRQRDKGFSAPGQLTSLDTRQFGGALEMALSDRDSVNFKVDITDEKSGRDSGTVVADVHHQLNDKWKLSAGVRADRRDDDAAVLSGASASTGNRADLAVQADYKVNDELGVYAFGQGTALRTDTRNSNNRGGVGSRYQINDRLGLKGEVSAGDGGKGALLGADYRLSDRTTTYLNYALDPDNGNNGIGNRQGRLVTGARTRYSDALSVYGEERYLHGGNEQGLTHAFGVDLVPDERWKFGLAIEAGRVTSDTSDLRRSAISLSMDYARDAFKYGSALEFRRDNDSTDSRKNWLMRNHLVYLLNPDWRMRGKLDFALSDSRQGDVLNADYLEALLGYAYRPIDNDRFNALLEYRYLMDQAPADQFTASGQQNDFQQRSHVFLTDLIYDLTPRWSVGGKYAIRYGALRAGRGQGDWFNSTAQLGVVRLDWHVVRHWDGLIEGRVLDVSKARDRRAGTLIAVYRHFGAHIKAGIGYNFTDFSDDLTDLSYDSRGAFVNIVGKL